LGWNCGYPHGLDDSASRYYGEAGLGDMLVLNAHKKTFTGSEAGEG